MPTTAEQTDILKHLDFEPACQARVASGSHIEGDCPDTATWSVHCRRCGRIFLACDRHRAIAQSDELMMCIRCRHHGPAYAVWEAKPLGGAL